MTLITKRGPMSPALQKVLETEPNVEIKEVPDPAPAQSLAEKYRGRLSKETADAILKDIEESKGDYPW